MLNAVNRDDYLGSTELSTLRLRTVQASPDPLSDALPLELGQRRQNVELELSGWRREVDALTE